MAKFAAIDVGSNAMRLTVVEASGPRAWKELAYQRVPVRLGRDVFLTNRLAPTALSAACDALRRFREVMDEHRIDRYRAVATSAVREAENGTYLVERARREAGIDVDVIEGIEEARLIRLAVIGRLALGDRNALLVDIGGGSTELSIVERGVLKASRSFPVGTVRLLEAFAGGDAQALAREYVDRLLREGLRDVPHGPFDVAIGTGGNFETLAALCPAKGPSPRAALGQVPLDTVLAPREQWPVVDLGAVRALLPKLVMLTPEERQKLYGLNPDRADVIVPAAEIIVGIASFLSVDRVVAPAIGLKDGVIEELIEKHFDVWDWGGEAAATMESARRLGVRYRYDQDHGEHVASLATDLFDQLRPLHRLGDRDRLLLQVASLLHDIGDFIRYEAHHRHSHYVITNSDFVGLSPRERSVVANVARYHRKAPPDPSHPNFRELERDERARVRVLAAILRIADALDREHARKVTGVRAVIERGKLRLHLAGARDRELEEWTVLRKSELFRDVFDLVVEVAKA